MAKINLTYKENRAKDKFVSAVERLLQDCSAEEVGRIADHVGEYGACDDAMADAVVVECLNVVVDALGRWPRDGAAERAEGNGGP